MRDFITNLPSAIISLFPCCYPEEEINPVVIPTTDAKLRVEGISKIQECYRRNIEAIMQAQNNGVFLNQGGILVFQTENFDKISPLEQEKGEELIKQVLRQAWGKVIDAQCGVGNEKKGPLLLEEAIHHIDLLQEKIRQTLPIGSAQKVLADEKWAKILANNYKATTNDLIDQLRASQVDRQDPQLQKIQFKLQARDKVLQEYREKKKIDYEFIQFTQDTGGVNFSGTKWVKKNGETYVVSKRGVEDVNWETPSLAWLNEMIGAAFDQISGCRFGTATSSLTLNESQELNTVHSFKKSDDRWHQAFDASPDLKSSHQFVLFNVLLKTQDAHKGNILCREENSKYIPIPIDLGRLLSHAPHRSLESLMRFTSFVNWSTLDQKFDEETKQFVHNLDPDHIVSTIRELFVNHPSLKKSQRDILERKLVHLRANILMVKEAVKEDLTPRQLIALATFKLTPHHINQMEEIVKDPKNTSHHGDLMRKYLLRHCHCAFLSAWNTARAEGTFNEEKFIRQIRQSVQSIKGVNVSKKYFYKAALKKFDDLYL